MMLAMMALMGALFAGVLAESVIASSDKSDEEPEGDLDQDPADPTHETGMPGGGGTSLIDDPDEDFDPVSTDKSDPKEDSVQLIGQDSDDFLSGNSADDQLDGASGNDQIDGRNGADVLIGGNGQDRLLGGEGDDRLLGGADADSLHGQDGDDLLDGGDGDDSLCGHEGDDRQSGGSGNDTLIGGGGNDQIFAQAGDDWAAGGDGDDLLRGGGGQDTLDGGMGNDTLLGGDAVPDFLNGGEGDDDLVLGAGDFGHGGEGQDNFNLVDWVAEGGVTTISDFNPEEDAIVLVYDATQTLNPDISLSTAETGDVTILVDGDPVAIVAGGAGLNLADIRVTAA